MVRMDVPTPTKGASCLHNQTRPNCLKLGAGVSEGALDAELTSTLQVVPVALTCVGRTDDSKYRDAQI